MAEAQIGAAVLRILGDVESGDRPTTRNVDVYAVLDALLKSEDLRSRCSSLSAFVQDASLAPRQTMCRALVIVLTSKFEPLQEAPKRSVLTGAPMGRDLTIEIDHRTFKSTTPQFAAAVCPTPGGLWKDHIHANYSKRGVAEWAKVSPHLYEMIAAVEALLNVQGHLLAK